MQKNYRIKKSKEIEQVMKKGRSKANPYFIVYKYPNKTNSNFRIAISVGKKVGKAFERNKIKRYIRTVTTEHKNQINPQYDYFIIARKGVKDLDYHMFKEQLERLYYKMGIINKTNN